MVTEDINRILEIESEPVAAVAYDSGRVIAKMAFHTWWISLALAGLALLLFFLERQLYPSAEFLLAFMQLCVLLAIILAVFAFFTALISLFHKNSPKRLALIVMLTIPVAVILFLVIFCVILVTGPNTLA
jgi:hypothetical protein